MKILAVDDDAISLRVLDLSLRKWGYDPITASDGREALALIDEHDVPIVVSDWMMPEVDGVELVRRVRAREGARYVYVILLTAKQHTNDLVEAMEAGADDFVTKPYEPDELRSRLRAAERVVLLERSLAEQNRALREAQTALVQSEKLASLGQLAAGLAHEINNPISWVTNSVAVVRRDVPQTPELLRQLELVDKGLHRVRDIVRNVLDFARLDEAHEKEADLNDGIRATAEMLRHELRTKDLDLRTDLRPLRPVLCQPGKINQVMLNLLLNAVHASDPGGVITVATRDGEAEVVVEVRDAGCGIAPEDLPMIFDPFFTTKPVGQGSGLGLAVSYRIVREHAGTIEVESERGAGAVFRVRLPRRRDDCEDGRAP